MLMAKWCSLTPAHSFVVSLQFVGTFSTRTSGLTCSIYLVGSFVFGRLRGACLNCLMYSTLVIPGSPSSSNARRTFRRCRHPSHCFGCSSLLGCLTAISCGQSGPGTSISYSSSYWKCRWRSKFSPLSRSTTGHAFPKPSSGRRWEWTSADLEGFDFGNLCLSISSNSRFYWLFAQSCFCTFAFGTMLKPSQLFQFADSLASQRRQRLNICFPSIKR